MRRRLPRGPDGGGPSLARIAPVARLGLAALGLLALVPPGSARATSIPSPLEVLAGDRTVVAESQISTATGFAEDRDADGAPDPGPFAGEALASVAVPGAEAAARATQASRLGPVIEASGSALAERVVVADPAFVVSRGESFFQTVFQSSGLEPLRLTAVLEVAESAGSDGFVLVEMGMAGQAPQLSERLDAPGRRELDLSPVFFAPGSVFQLTALARADALGGPDAQSSFSVRVAPVPGPGAAALSLPALLGMLGIRGRGRACDDASS